MWADGRKWHITRSNIRPQITYIIFQTILKIPNSASGSITSWDLTLDIVTISIYQWRPIRFGYGGWNGVEPSWSLPYELFLPHITYEKETLSELGQYTIIHSTCASLPAGRFWLPLILDSLLNYDFHRLELRQMMKGYSQGSLLY